MGFGRRKVLSRVKHVVKGFREDHPALIVDIHDGHGDEKEKLVKYLHQSDLLILDYELDDNGEKSVEITKSIFSNAHFNLIVVHTNAEPQEPFEKYLLALLKPCESLQSQKIEQRISAGSEQIEQAEDKYPDIAVNVINTVGFQQYMHFRHPGNKSALKTVYNGEAPFGDFDVICKEMDWKHKVPGDIFLWALQQYEKANAGSFDNNVTVADNWSQISSNRLWIRTNKGFITFVKKNNEMKLLDELRTSLEDWRPSPSRLMSAMLRYELDDQGVIAEDQVLESKLLHAKFYKDLFEKNTDESRQVAIDAQIGRHLDDMGNLIKKSVMPFMKKLVEADKIPDGTSNFINHYGIDIRHDKNNKAAINKFNAYISCYPEVTGWHLAPGHILNISEEKWVCLSPVCDLVPGQKTSAGISGIYSETGKGKPFLAVKLHNKNGDLDSKKVNSNNFLFLPTSSTLGEVEQYSFYDGSGTDPNESLSPHWSLFIAENGGKFNPQDKKIGISKINYEGPEVKGAAEEVEIGNVVDEAEVEVDDTTDEILGLSFKHQECVIVAQLRYEYALNLVQKLGAEQTRVGLGYVSS